LHGTPDTALYTLSLHDALPILLSIPFMMGFIGSLFGRTGGEAALWTFAAAVTVVPFGILVARARRFLASGFGPEELAVAFRAERSEEHTSELQSRFDLVCRLLL